MFHGMENVQEEFYAWPGFPVDKPSEMDEPSDVPSTPHGNRKVRNLSIDLFIPYQIIPLS